MLFQKKPAQNPAANFDFLQNYVEETLRQSGFGNLSEEMKKEFMPRFVAQAELRLGAALLPLLSESSAKEMSKMIDARENNPEEWLKFWQRNIKDFDNVAQKVLKDFAEEIKQMANDIK